MNDQLAEKAYLENTLAFLNERLETEYKEISEKKGDLIAYKREMYENSSHHSQDFNKLTEMVQYLNPLVMQTIDYEATEQRISLYEKMIKAPYFARVDFKTPRWGNETIYIGIGNLENEETFDVYVYDWRAPISSIFYRFELGEAYYQAPSGKIEGEITLKRQYEIENGELKYFFDSSVNIVDNILKQALSQNTSTTMRTIVETIQREQDIIIRDVDNDLVIVQGVAGSGKTSIALHRVAYLMYQGLTGHLKANDIILISPNQVFEQYISEVLPELGEKNIKSVTFENLFYTIYNDEKISFKKRNAVLEEILTASPKRRKLLQDNYRFKCSATFLEILKRLIHYFEHSMVPFTDIMYGGKIIAQKDLLKARFLNSGTRSLPVQVRLNHLESLISGKMQELRPRRLKQLEKFVNRNLENSFDYKAQARLLNSKQTSAVMREVRRFTRINYLELYVHLFENKALFAKLSEGLNLPDNMDEIAELTVNEIKYSKVNYIDAMALFLLRLRMDSTQENVDIRQVVVDEAQDYSPVHFEILARLFPSAKYTVLGDINQTIVDTNEDDVYESAVKALKKKKSIKVSLNKSFRCSFEIAVFASQFSDKNIEIEHLDRFSQVPQVIHSESTEVMHKKIIDRLDEWGKDGFETLAIVCKSSEEASELYRSLYPMNKNLKLLVDDKISSISGTMILPVYLAKGLEFDGVIVYNTNADNYYTDDDRRLLYVSATRALHRLSMFYEGELSELITPPDDQSCLEPVNSKNNGI